MKYSSNREKKIVTFFDLHPIFTLREFETFLHSYYSGNSHTRKSLIQYYIKTGRISRIRRGLYRTVKAWQSPDHEIVDIHMLASKLASDAVISFHSALEFLGVSYSLFNTTTFCSTKTVSPLVYQDHIYKQTSFFPEILKQNAQFHGLKEVEHLGGTIRVTGFERTLCEVLTRPEHCGSWEEIWRSLEAIEYFDLNALFSYLELLGNATTFSKVGFFLEQHQEQYMVDEGFLTELSKGKPKQPHYLERTRRSKGKLINRWNLMVPQEIIERSWSEVL